MARTIFLVSDRTGITIETLAHTVLTQFDAALYETVSLPFTDTPDKVRAVIARIDETCVGEGEAPLVFSSLVSAELRALLQESRGVIVDLFEVLLPLVQPVLGASPTHTVGLAHAIGDAGRYDDRVDAINFTLMHDDGGAVSRLEDADVILIGVSRSGKTPTCLYLAMHYGIRAANYPLTEEDLQADQLPAVLLPHRQRLVGLTISAERLRSIRFRRRPDSRYASLEQCRLELRWAENLFAQHAVPVLDTTAVSIEEIAVTIRHRLGLASTAVGRRA